MARRRRRAWLSKFRKTPLALQVGGAALLLLVIALGANWLFQAARKPAELLFPVGNALDKMPAETWRTYGPLFREHATATISPELLATLAQLEGAGNPAARTYWRWRLSREPFDVYRPASSAVGMYQITDATYREAKRYCVRDHVVVEAGPWHDWNSCWFNSLYIRVLPSHAIEMTAGYLDRRVAGILAARGLAKATPQQKNELAAVIHLCGAGAGVAFAARSFRALDGQRCGDHELARYLVRFRAMQRVFRLLAREPGSPGSR